MRLHHFTVEIHFIVNFDMQDCLITGSQLDSLTNRPIDRDYVYL